MTDAATSRTISSTSSAIRSGRGCRADGTGLASRSVRSFINDGALSRGASIAFYTVTSIGPVLLIVVAISGLSFGQDAARGAIVSQLSGLMGQQSAELLQNVIRSASGKPSGVFASAFGVITLLVTASGVFGEMQSALNAIWKADPKGGTVSRLLRARAASLGLVAALGFLLLVSLVISAGLSALSEYMNAYLPFGHYSASREFPDLVRPDLGPVRGDLQGTARQGSGMARRAGRRRRDRLPVQYRQVPDRALHRKQCGCLQL